MKVYNIYKNQKSDLAKFEDDRGQITDIFYQTQIDHACIVTNNSGAIRGNHYHKHTTQYIYIISGTLTYYSRFANDDGPINHYSALPGDFIISEPNEIHATKAGPEGCTFIAFAAGPRGGKNYENDTYRVESIII